MRLSSNYSSLIFLSFSFLGLVLIVAITNFSPKIQDTISWRKPLVGAVFSIICTLGILAGISPSRCSSMFHFRKSEQDKVIQESTWLPKKTFAFRGHHPDCDNFRSHVFRVDGKVFCAGCVGLILGATLSFLGVALYFFINLSFWSNYYVISGIGFAGVSCGLLQYHLFKWGKSSIHLAVNAFLVLGVFLLLVGVDAITQNILFDFYLIALSIFWLYTRILLSQVDHREVCTACQVNECKFHKRKNVEKGYGLRRIP